MHFESEGTYINNHDTATGSNALNTATTINILKPETDNNSNDFNVATTIINLKSRTLTARYSHSDKVRNPPTNNMKATPTSREYARMDFDGED